MLHSLMKNIKNKEEIAIETAITWKTQEDKQSSGLMQFYDTHQVNFCVSIINEQRERLEPKVTLTEEEAYQFIQTHHAIPDEFGA